MSRRQNSSCDQCRKGKRACDAVWLRDHNIQRTVDAQLLEPAPLGTSAIPSHGGMSHHSLIGDKVDSGSKGTLSSCRAATNMTSGLDGQLELTGPCTNCARTNKQCTFEWVQSQQIQRKDRLSLSSNPSALSDRKGNSPAAASTASQSPAPSNMLQRPLRPSAQHPTPENPYLPYAYPLTAEEQLLLGSCHYPSSGPDRSHASTSGAAGLPYRHGSLSIGETPVSIPTTAHLVLSASENGHQGHPPFMDVSGHFAEYSLGPFDHGSNRSHASSHAFHNASGGADAFGAHTWSMPTSVAISNNSPPNDLNHNRKRRRTLSPTHITPAPPTPAPSWDPMTGDRLARSTNGSMIGETIMKIYHDVMEGALSCWLVEHTCPYKSLPPTPGDTPDTQRFGSLEDMHKEWGPNWSNRIYRRVIKLDRMAHLLGLKRLGQADEIKVSSALNSVVMAFTAQWAQSSQRSSARWPGSAGLDGSHGYQPPDPDIGEEFDRTLQKTFWNQARRALDDCSEIDSFRVAFAEIIFGLTQKYVEVTGAQQGSSLTLDKNVDMSEVVDEILRGDRQQMWLERATRRLHVLRRRVELYDRQRRNREDGRQGYDAEYRKTIDLLFWLAIMFDTISAAMTERPLTVSDEDTSNLALSYSIPTTSSTTSSTTNVANMARRWNTILTKDQQTKITSLRWPLSIEVIAQELSDAAPVKVLLYRKITRLQTLIARGSDTAAIEETIEDALMVYRHWQLLYHPLFTDLIENHLSLSSRIQSWHVCLLGHWLLATLLIADLIQCVDQRGLGMAAETRRRVETGRAAGIRRASVRMVSDLARASAPRDDDYGQLENFHDAVKDGALLTEPWTMILIRTFAGAAIALLEEGEGEGEGVGARPAEGSVETRASHQPVDHRGALERCEDCVKALFYLGARKSDMARQVADVLAGCLQRARLKVRT